MLRRILLATYLTAVLSGVAQADSFSFSIGSGYRGHHHGHHHHHDCYGPAFGFSLWSPPPARYVYVAPPPVVHYVQPQPVIIQQPPPVTSYGAAASAPAPNVAANQLPSPPARTVATGAPVVIRNSSNKGVPVAFLVDDKSEELRDGQTRTYSGSSHIIEFDRGGNLGTARYELTSGLYSFVVGDNGWQLLRDSTSTTRTADRPAVKRNELPFEVER